MVIKLIPLTKAYPNSGHDTNKVRSYGYAHAGIDYLRASDAVIGASETYGPFFYVVLPLLHMSLELLIKAHAALTDDSFDPKKYRHCSKKILERYASKNKGFEGILSDAKKIELVVSLEKAWEIVRYAESYIGFDGSDLKLAQTIAVELANSYRDATGIPLLAHHYPVQKAKNNA